METRHVRRCSGLDDRTSDSAAPVAAAHALGAQHGQNSPQQASRPVHFGPLWVRQCNRRSPTTVHSAGSPVVSLDRTSVLFIRLRTTERAETLEVVLLDLSDFTSDQGADCSRHRENSAILPFRAFVCVSVLQAFFASARHVRPVLRAYSDRCQASLRSRPCLAGDPVVVTVTDSMPRSTRGAERPLSRAMVLLTGISIFPTQSGDLSLLPAEAQLHAIGGLPARLEMTTPTPPSYLEFMSPAGQFEPSVTFAFNWSNAGLAQTQG